LELGRRKGCCIIHVLLVFPQLFQLSYDDIKPYYLASELPKEGHLLLKREEGHVKEGKLKL
jgi:hypothetical protein